MTGSHLLILVSELLNGTWEVKITKINIQWVIFQKNGMLLYNMAKYVLFWLAGVFFSLICVVMIPVLVLAGMILCEQHTNRNSKLWPICEVTVSNLWRITSSVWYIVLEIKILRVTWAICWAEYLEYEEVLGRRNARYTWRMTQNEQCWGPGNQNKNIDALIGCYKGSSETSYRDKW